MIRAHLLRWRCAPRCGVRGVRLAPVLAPPRIWTLLGAPTPGVRVRSACGGAGRRVWDLAGSMGGVIRVEITGFLTQRLRVLPVVFTERPRTFNQNIDDGITQAVNWLHGGMPTTADLPVTSTTPPSTDGAYGTSDSQPSDSGGDSGGQ